MGYPNSEKSFFMAAITVESFGWSYAERFIASSIED
jgi:hypothetical protein